MIENVGNPVCPAMFDLGKLSKVVITSVTEGEDKPLKYRHIFYAAVMIMNKVDLAPHADFDIEKCINNAKRVNLELTVFELFAKTAGELEAVSNFLKNKLAAI